MTHRATIPRAAFQALLADPPEARMQALRDLAARLYADHGAGPKDDILLYDDGGKLLMTCVAQPEAAA